MKKLQLVATLIGLCAATAFAEPQGFGIGVMIGEPTGISAKHWLGPTRAIDGAAAWSISGEDSFSFHADYLFHNRDVVTNMPSDALLHYGLGARFRVREGDDNGNGENNDGDDTFGVRLPFGFTYLIKGKPIEFFMELAPVVELVPDTDLDLDAGVGVRYYFH